jgi:hypothetical protein
MRGRGLSTFVNRALGRRSASEALTALLWEHADVSADELPAPGNDGELVGAFRETGRCEQFHHDAFGRDAGCDGEFSTTLIHLAQELRVGAKEVRAYLPRRGL